jgi:hypothetical protein
MVAGIATAAAASESIRVRMGFPPKFLISRKQPFEHDAGFMNLRQRANYLEKGMSF